jgi:hypothetical protein
MNTRRLAAIASALLISLSMGSLSFKARAQAGPSFPARYADLPPGATRCDPSLPIWIDLSLLNVPAVGESARFEVQAETILDPDLIKNSWVEYEVPSRVRRMASAEGRHSVMNRSGRGRAQMEVVVPDEARYEIRAHLVVELLTGQVLRQTAVRWIDLGEEDPPEGMIGRITRPDGTGIRIYRGATVRN